MSFEWQTEEDYSWDEEPAPPEPVEPGQRRWPWVLLVLVLLVSTAVFLFYRQLNQRVEAATDDVEADLIASYVVLQQAAENQDENLFNSLLSGREPAWAVAQRDNLVAGLLFDRPGFGLAWQPVLAETAVLSQTLSPELNAAELTTLQNYSLDIGNGLTHTVQLERLDVYRLGEDRWLYAPPERDFWGVRRRLEGQLLSVRYPARDEEIVHRLAADLEAKLVQLCSTPGYTCPPDARVRLIFLPEPASLTDATFIGALTRQDMGDVLTGGQAIGLPTPSLVGLPQDEAGYQVLLRGYAAQMLTLALNDLLGWECCANVPFYRAAVERQLYELGVRDWPLLDTAVSLPNDFTLGSAALFWHAPFPEIPTDFAQTPAPYVVVDFLVNELHLTPRQIATFLISYKQFIFGQWLVDLTGSPWTQATLNHAFQEYVVQWQDEPVELAEPDFGLTLLCHDGGQQAAGLYYYDFSLETPLLLENVPDSELYFTGLPDGSGIAAAGRDENGRPQTYLLRNGEPRLDVTWNEVLGITQRPPLAIPTVTDPNGRYLLWTVAPTFAAVTFFGLTDLDSCQSGDNCEAIPLGGYPIWSPASERLLTLTVTNPWWNESLLNGLMLLRQAPQDEAINSPGFGSSIFWLDETQFGYVAQFQNGQQQVMLADIELERPQMAFSNETVRRSIPEESRPNELTIQFVSPLPNNPRLFVVLASDLESENAVTYLFHFDRATGNVTLSVTLDTLLPGTALAEPGIRFSPDGRFLLITDGQEDQPSAPMLLYDTREQRFIGFDLQEQTGYPPHFYASWSPDSQWLAMPELGYIRLWHNSTDERLLKFDNLFCTNAAWVDRMER